ncbi:stage II sporulation protein P [Lacrimispora sp. NSJ-141]|uniref:Stage II sporulation protein P n=1 Tax=Lientehia hominis TaxID=2897778 RepID=A0AAP2RIY0_9FIRM|nr:stage II sporulation protein P [Lientehia hominis]MCD2492832.1 stage II sporulation protein P [Lientehia hominis]
MSFFNRHHDSRGSGAALVVLVAFGWFLLRGGPARLTALAARLPMSSFVSKEEARAVSAGEGGSGAFGLNTGQKFLELASGVHSISLFLGEQDAALAQAQPDPAYQNFQKENEMHGETQDEPESTAEAGAASASEPAETTAAGQTETDGSAPENEGGAETAAEGIGEAAGQPAMAATEIKGTVYTAEQLSDFDFLKSKFFYVHKSTTAYPEQLDANMLMSKDLSLPESGEPQILLFHTHGSEAFSDSAEGDPNMTVVGVGNYLAQLLSEQYGIQVIHNTEVFPYSDSYSMALGMLNQTLAENPSIQVTIDLHRDSGGHDVVDINGKPTAPIMFFNGMCQTPDGPLDGVENPYLLDNLAFNFQMKLKAEAYYPGFTLRTFLKAYRYNQHVLPRATLVEVGTENNTFEEAKNAMEPLADILYKVLRGK